jgi:hypothetical protein
MNGFEMLEQFSEILFAVIFTTGYDRMQLKPFVSAPLIIY